MKNISLFKKITVINIAILVSFMSLFTILNTRFIQEQTRVLDYDKYLAIATNTEQIISINISLGIESGYKEALKNLLKLNEEIQYIKITDLREKVLYSLKKQEDLKIESLNNVGINLVDTLKNEKIGRLNLYYENSSSYLKMLEEHTNYMYSTIIIFIIVMVFLSVLIFYSLRPLRVLARKMLLYKAGMNLDIQKQEGKDEVCVITNATVDMLYEIQKEYTNRLEFEKELAHKNRLISMGEMIDNIAHQWRQPLMSINAILMNIDRTFELGKLNEEYLQEKVEQISKTTKHMSQTIEDFRGFFSKEKHLQTVSLDTLVFEVLVLLKPLLSGISVDTKKVQKVNIEIYKSELMQVFINIITNSVDILAQRDVENKKIKIEVIENAHLVDIVLYDNGGGIAKEDKTRVFEPYYTTKHQFGGTGLGLYICKMIVQNNLKGSIDFYNIESGVAFKISLRKIIQND